MCWLDKYAILLLFWEKKMLSQSQELFEMFDEK